MLNLLIKNFLGKYINQYLNLVNLNLLYVNQIFLLYIYYQKILLLNFLLFYIFQLSFLFLHLLVLYIHKNLKFLDVIIPDNFLVFSVSQGAIKFILLFSSSLILLSFSLLLNEINEWFYISLDIELLLDIVSSELFNLLYSKSSFCESFKFI